MDKVTPLLDKLSANRSHDDISLATVIPDVSALQKYQARFAAEYSEVNAELRKQYTGYKRKQLAERISRRLKDYSDTVKAICLSLEQDAYVDENHIMRKVDTLSRSSNIMVSLIKELICSDNKVANTTEITVRKKHSIKRSRKTKKRRKLLNR